MEFLRIEHGYLKCPKCFTNGMNNFREFESKCQFKDGNPVKSYIFYKSFTSCILCSICRDEKTDNVSEEGSQSRNDSNSDCDCGDCILYLFAFAFYLIIFVWFDLANYCTKKKKEYSHVMGITKKTNKIEIKKSIITKNIWNQFYGIPEENLYRNEILSCQFCKYKALQISEFISNKTNMNTSFTQEGTMSNFIRNNNGVTLVNINDLITISFESVDQRIKFSNHYPKSYKFRMCVNDLINNYSELKQKKLFFISNGGQIDENKTLEESKLKNGEKIIISEL